MATVLVVDDSTSDRKAIVNALKAGGYTVYEADNGDDGVQEAINKVPDCVIMDVIMPGQNGFNATRKITKNETTSHIPVLILTTKDQESDRVWGNRQGAKAYMTKPFTPEGLLSVVAELIAD